MQPSQPDDRPAMPALVLALVLLGVLAAGGLDMLNQLRMAPSTLLPAAALAPKHNSQGMSAAVVAPSEETHGGPSWSALSNSQKLALYPLAERWALLSEIQKRRWLALAQTFPALPKQEQEKLHSRMTEWASLSAQQRNQARLNYATSNRLARDNKLAQWEAYQALSEEERRILAARAAPKPQGAATALSPAPARKLAQIPAAEQANPNRPNPPKILPPQNLIPQTPESPPPAITASERSSSAASTTAVETTPVNTPTAAPTPLPPLVTPGDAPGSGASDAGQLNGPP